MYIDLHAHTYPASDDSFVSADELVAGAKRAGLDGICLTEHDYFWDPDQIDALSRRHDFLVLAGSEINTEYGHLLVFGLDTYVFGMHKAAFVVASVEQRGGAIVAAHPYRRRYPKGEPGRTDEMEQALATTCQEQIFPLCHAIEVFNGRGSAMENAFSDALAHRLEVGRTGGSDSHRLDHVGGICTRFHRRITCVADLVQELRAGRFEPVGPDSTGAAAPA